MRQTHPNVLSAEFEPMASFDKYDTLVQANHDQLGSLEETFVLWKQRVQLLTTAADQSPGSQKMEERRRERGDKKLIGTATWDTKHECLNFFSICRCVLRHTANRMGGTFPSPRFVVHFWPGVPFFIPMKSLHDAPFSSLDDLGSFQDKQQLMFCRKVFDRQLADAAECHLEHPVNAC